MEELRKALQDRLKQCRQERLSAGDYRDSSRVSMLDGAEEELEWILRQIESKMEIDPTRVFPDPVTFHDDVVFDRDVVFEKGVIVKGTLTTSGFNRR